MTVTISGTSGLAGVNGSASTPAVQGEDTNTGMFFPAADTVAVATGGSERMRVDSSGNVGVGTASPSGASGRVLEINGGAGQARLVLKNDTTGSTSSDGSQIALVGSQLVIQNRENSEITFETNLTERARIDSSGNLLVGTTSQLSNAKVSSVNSGSAWAFAGRSNSRGYVFQNIDASGIACYFTTNNDTQLAGQITVNNSTATYATSSDYRLKENVAPMQNALDTVAQLNPVTYTWKADGSAGQGFIAHELQAVVPDCVTGEKDAVDETGNPQYQGVDTSFLVATLCKAIQELKAEVDSLRAQLNP